MIESTVLNHLAGAVNLLLQDDSGGDGSDEVNAGEVVESFDGCDDTDGICAQVFEITNSQTAANVTEFLADNVVQILIIITVSLVMLFVIKRVVRRLMNHVADGAIALKEQQTDDGDLTDREKVSLEQDSLRIRQRTDTLAAIIFALCRFGVWTIAFILVLGEFGINLGPLVAGAGVVGVALGFGAQKVVGDFLSGIFMISEDQFGVGDVVDVGEAQGTVERLTLRTTVLRDIYGTVWHVPNGVIERVGNKSQRWSKALLDVGVAYGTDVDTASEVLLNAAHELAHDDQWADSFLDEPEVLGVEALDADAVTIRISVRTRPARQFDVQRELNRRFKRALDEAGIEIPFPQRTVWLRPDSDPEDSDPAGDHVTDPS
ncbi:MAG: mechanosensitive ion channel family protein [Microthrixaceae bacterium]